MAEISKTATFRPSYAINIQPSFKHYTNTRPQALQVRAQNCRDEGTSGDNVDANMGVLRQRIELVKIKERLDRSSRCKNNGWNYRSAAGYNNYKLKRNLEISQFFELVSLVAATVGFTFLTGTFLICLVSFFVHLN